MKKFTLERTSTGHLEYVMGKVFLSVILTHLVLDEGYACDVWFRRIARLSVGQSSDRDGWRVTREE